MSIGEEQFGFVKGKSTADAILCKDSCKKDTEKDSKIYTVYSLIWKKNLRQGSEGRTVLVHARQGGAREVHQTGEGHVPSRNCSEVCAGTSEPFQWKLDSTKDLLSALSCLPS